MEKIKKFGTPLRRVDCKNLKGGAECSICAECASPGGYCICESDGGNIAKRGCYIGGFFWVTNCKTDADCASFGPGAICIPH